MVVYYSDGSYEEFKSQLGTPSVEYTGCYLCGRKTVNSYVCGLTNCPGNSPYGTTYYIHGSS